MRQTVLMAALLLCAPVLAVEPARPIAFGLWHIDGHRYEWQAAQLDAGLPLEPCIRVPDWPVLFDPTFLHVNSPLTLDQGAPLLQTFDRQSLVLRMNNITNLIDDAVPRIDPLTDQNWSQSHLAIRRLADGTLDDTPMPSPFAGTAPWATIGRRYAETVWMRKLQTLIPAPTSIILREDNEGPRLEFSAFYQTTRVLFYRPDNNTIQFATINTPREKWLWDGSTPTDQRPIVGDWRVLSGNTGDTLIAYRWLSDAELDRVDLRARDWVGLMRSGSPNAAYAPYQALIRNQYQAFYDAFRAALSPAWRDVPFRTVGYANNQHGQNPTASLQTYMGYYRPPALTDPAHAKEIADRRAQWQQELADPSAWRELSVRHRGPTIYAAVQNGTGDYVDSDSFAGYMAHYLWSMQAPGRESRIVWWEGYLAPPSQPVALSTSWQQTLTSLGRPDLNALTVGECEVAVMQRMQEILQHPLLLRYYREGATVILPSPQNTTTVQRVYATQTTLPDSPRKLLAVYTPCSATQVPTIHVGVHVLPHARWTYMLTEPLEPLPPPVLTLEQRVERLERRVFGDGPIVP